MVIAHLVGLILISSLILKESKYEKRVNGDLEKIAAIHPKLRGLISNSGIIRLPTPIGSTYLGFIGEY